MKKLLILIITAFISLALPLAAFAQNPKPTPQVVVLTKSQTVNHDYLAGGNTVDIEGTVNGDVYAGGGTVLVDGTVNGDILAGGGQITIKGKVNNVRVAGGQILIDGTVDGNVSAVGGNITIGSGAKIAGGLVGAGGQFNILGQIGKTVYLGSANVTLDSSVGSDMSVNGGRITLSPNARINGNLWYMSPNRANLESGSSIGGKVTYVPTPSNQKSSLAAPLAFLAGASLIFSLYKLVFAFLIGLALILLVPFYTRNTIDTIIDRPWLYLGIGILGWVITPILAILLAVTIILFPLIFVEIFAVIVFTYIGKIFFAIFLGNWILERFNTRRTHLVWALVLGLIIDAVLGWIPVIGWLWALITVAIGFGAVLLQEGYYYQQLRAKKLL